MQLEMFEGFSSIYCCCLTYVGKSAISIRCDALMFIMSKCDGKFLVKAATG
jgi:hypothetical protein